MTSDALRYTSTIFSKSAFFKSPAGKSNSESLRVLRIMKMTVDRKVKGIRNNDKKRYSSVTSITFCATQTFFTCVCQRSSSQSMDTHETVICNQSIVTSGFAPYLSLDSKWSSTRLRSSRIGRSFCSAMLDMFKKGAPATGLP